MRRSEALKPLSREHHAALLAAKEMREATDVSEATRAFTDFWDGGGRRHFRIEEEVLLPVWAGYVEVDRRAAMRMLDEHLSIRGRARRLVAGTASPADAVELGELLRDHVRFEERELFPLIEAALDAAQLDVLGQAIEEARGARGKTSPHFARADRDGREMSNPPLRPESTGSHPVYAVAGGNHVTIELDREETGGELDVVEVLAQPGGGPPPHKHAFGEWFLIREGELTLCEEREGVVVPTATIAAGASVWVPPWTVHGTFNLSADPVRFQVVGRPGAMSAYFAEAGVLVTDELTPPTTEPAGPDELREIAARWGIEFWSGPVEKTGPR